MSLAPNDASGKAPAPDQSTQLNTSNGTQLPGAETPSAQNDELSPKFAALAKREKAFRAREMAIKAKEEQLTRDFESRLEAKQRELEQSYRSRLKQDPWGEFSSAGMTPEEVTQHLLNQPTPQDQTLRTVQEQIRALQKQNEELITKTQDSETKRNDRAEALVRKEIDIIVDGREEYETIQAMNAKQAVLDLIKDTLEEDGYMMSVDDAANKVEEYLVEQALGFTKLKKLQAKLNPPVAVDPNAALKTAPNVQKQTHTTKTLSQNLRQQTPPPARLTESERKRRAIMVAKGLDPDTGQPRQQN